MNAIETLEGTIVTAVHFHYDVGTDVLYLTLTTEREADAYGEEDDHGIILRRQTDNDHPIRLTIVNWWQRFGEGELLDSLQEIARHIEPLKTELEEQFGSRAISGSPEPS